MSRIACLFAPAFPLAARLRAEPELSGKALVICRGNGAAARIEAISRAAWRFGIRPGITLARARCRLPDLIARSRDSAAEKATHEVLLETASTLSPRVEDAAEDMVFADVSGMEKLFPGAEGEKEMAQIAILSAENLSLLIQVGIAGAKLPARIAAGRRESPWVIPPGEEAAFLAGMPLRSLGISEKLQRTLHRWGLQNIGDLAALPADRAGARLGAEGRAAQRIALGEDSTPLHPSSPPQTLSEGMELEWAVVNIEALLASIRPCLERLHERMAHQDLVCRLLELELGLEPEGVDRRLIRLPIPARDVEALLCLSGLQIEARPPHAPVFSFRCIIHPTQPRSSQLTLFGPPEIHPDSLAITLARLAARLGPDRVGSPRIVDTHLPESDESGNFDPPPTPPLRSLRGRGLLAVRVLRPPIPLEVIVEEDPGNLAENSEFQKLAVARPRSLSTHQDADTHIQGLIRIASGPWDVEEGWWREEGVRREYWDIEISGGGLYRIYRDARDGEWYADGVYD